MILKKLNLGYRIKAGALQFTMFIVVVIALLLTAFIILVHTYKAFRMQTTLTLETVNHTNKGVHYALTKKLKLNDTTRVNLQDDTNKILKIHRDYWGVFEKITAVSSAKKNAFKKIALVGAPQPETNRMALYLEDQNRPLVLVGNTRIQGKVYLPKQGVRSGNISGHSYYGQALIYGKVRTSQSLPKLQTELLTQIKHINKAYLNMSPKQFIELGTKRTFKNSFKNPLKIIYSNASIDLSEVELTGHILVQSETKIVVGVMSKLIDIILVAPEIEIQDNVKGTFQAFASKQITVGNNCRLWYPSALVLEEKEKATISSVNLEETPDIEIKQGVEIGGVIVFQGVTQNYRAQVFIDEEATITGEVYCNKNLELLGKVHGSVFTNGFVANQSGSVYQNHIYNGVINIDDLAPEYVGLPFENSKKGIVKWLY